MVTLDDSTLVEDYHEAVITPEMEEQIESRLENVRKFASQFETKDSGSRDEFDTGSVRDKQEGKGRYDLISPHALQRLADLYERGASKYKDRNWEKGMPYTRVFDSMVRHAYQWLRGDADEDHLAAVAWNAFALIHYEEMTARGFFFPEELDDRPDWAH